MGGGIDGLRAMNRKDKDDGGVGVGVRRGLLVKCVFCILMMFLFFFLKKINYNNEWKCHLPETTAVEKKSKKKQNTFQEQ